MKKLLLLVSIFALSGMANAQAVENVCEGSTMEREICLLMRSLRAQLHALDAQRELMQVNPPYIKTLGAGISSTSRLALEKMGIGIPEHRSGLVRLAFMADELVDKAEKNDGQMMYVANRMRGNCASCHAARNPPGGHTWDDIFQYDWNDISYDCNTSGKNPYLCKSMHGLLSANGYHRTALAAGVQDYDLTREAAQEIVRILDDLKIKGFRHLPEKRREEAIQSAQEVIGLANAKDPAVFEKSVGLMNSCTRCHQQVEDDNPDFNTGVLRNHFGFTKKST